MPGGLRRWWASRPLRHIALDELTEIAGNDWSRAWVKLDIQPVVCGQTILGELAIEGRPAVPLMAFVGYSSRLDVVDALRRQLGLDDVNSSAFLDCSRDRDFVIAHIEGKLARFRDG